MTDCRRCKNPIEPARLELVPTEQACSRCAMELEAGMKKLAERRLVDKTLAAVSSKCPGCGYGTIVLKGGVYGGFFGCSTFPRCKYKAVAR